MKIGETEKGPARKRAAYFYEKCGFDESNPPTPKKLAEALYMAAGDMRPSSWYNLKRYVMFDQHEKGFQKAVDRLSELKNPMTDKKVGIMLKPSKDGVKPKRKRLKAMPTGMHQKLFETLSNREKHDRPLIGTIYILNKIGCRPSEIPNLRMTPDGDVYVTHVKGSESGDRGIDHIIKLDPKDVNDMRIAINLAHEEPASKTPFEKKLGNRFKVLCKEIYPRRKSLPSLYTYRHDMGSNLKAAIKAGQISRAEAAYMMGHQSTESLDVYGDRRCGNGVSIKPAVDAEKIAEIVREKHSEPPSVDTKNDGSGGWQDGGGGLTL